MARNDMKVKVEFSEEDRELLKCIGNGQVVMLRKALADICDESKRDPNSSSLIWAIAKDALDGKL